ncbi:MAG: FliH/SctL family protein [Planctomycetota bacterium]
MPVIKGDRAIDAAKQAFVLDLGDLERRGAEIVLAARGEADRIIAEARAERKRLIAGAKEKGHAEGFEAGKAEGIAAGRKQGEAAAMQAETERLQQLTDVCSEAMTPFFELRSALLESARRDALRLALLLGERVVKRAIEVDEDVAVAQVGAVLEQLARRSRVLIKVHPEDRPGLKQALPRLVESVESVEHADLVEDDSIGRGGCVITTDAGGRIDATITTQLDRLVAELMPGSVREVESPEVDETEDDSGEDTA